MRHDRRARAAAATATATATATAIVAIAGACCLAEFLAVPVASASPSPAAVGLQANDVPGYSPVAPTLATLTSTTLPRALRQCAAGDPLLGQFGDGPAATISTLYGEGEGPFGVPALLVGTAVFTDGSATNAERAFTTLDSAATQSCWLSTYTTITTAIVSGLATLQSSGRSSLPPLSLGSNAPSTGFAFHIALSVFGQPVSDSVEVTAIRVGSIVTMIFTLSTNETFPEPVRAGVARNVAGRMGAASPSPSPNPVPSGSCRRAGIPEPDKPVLTDAQVEGIVHFRLRFEGETTNGASICVWSVTTRSKVATPSNPGVPATTWQVLVDGPLASDTAARDAYDKARAGASTDTKVSNLGDAAEFVNGATPLPLPRLIVRAGRYFLQFSSATANSTPTQKAVLHGLASAVLVRLDVASSWAGSLTGKQWADPNWAGRAFCKAYGQPVLAIFRGVASCGHRYVNTNSNTTPRPICYPVHKCRRPGVDFDTTGFQCVEYADRYFYYMTGISSFPSLPGSDTAEGIYYKFHKHNPQLGLVPLARVGGTNKYKPSLVKGDIISMWSPGDSIGHVAVVKSVRLTKHRNGKYSGTITMINQNAQHGVTPITVATNVLTYGGGYFTTFQWLTGLPTS